METHSTTKDIFNNTIYTLPNNQTVMILQGRPLNPEEQKNFSSCNSNIGTSLPAFVQPPGEQAVRVSPPTSDPILQYIFSNNSETTLSPLDSLQLNSSSNNSLIPFQSQTPTTSPQAYYTNTSGRFFSGPSSSSDNLETFSGVPSSINSTHLKRPRQYPDSILSTTNKIPIAGVPQKRACTSSSEEKIATSTNAEASSPEAISEDFVSETTTASSSSTIQSKRKRRPTNFSTGQRMAYTKFFHMIYYDDRPEVSESSQLKNFCKKNDLDYETFRRWYRIFKKNPTGWKGEAPTNLNKASSNPRVQFSADQRLKVVQNTDEKGTMKKEKLKEFLKIQGENLLNEESEELKKLLLEKASQDGKIGIEINGIKVEDIINSIINEIRSSISYNIPVGTYQMWHAESVKNPNWQGVIGSTKAKKTKDDTNVSSSSDDDDA